MRFFVPAMLFSFLLTATGVPQEPSEPASESVAPVADEALPDEPTPVSPTPIEQAAPPLSPYTIAIVTDGPSLYFDYLIGLVEKELKVLVGEERPVAFKQDPSYCTDWDAARAVQVLEKAMTDPGIDLIFAGGILAAQEAAKPGVPLSRPVISGFVQDPEAVGLPYDKEGHSTKKNFNFVIIPLRSSRDLEVFYSLVPFKNLGVMMEGKLQTQLDGLDDAIVGAEKQFSAKLHIVPMDLSAQEALDRLPEGLDAVYLTPAMRMPLSEWKKVIEGVNKRKLPSFSLMGHVDVEQGVLAGLMPEASDRLARRLALNIQQIMDGVAPEKLQVMMNLDESLFINAKTAADIGFHPNFEVMLQAEFLHEESLLQGDRLTLEQAVELALENNYDLTIKAAEVRGSRHDRNLALSTLFPQVDGNMVYSRIDSDRAESSSGLQPEEKTTVGISATQILFNDPVLSQYRASTRSYVGRLWDADSTRLDVIEAAAKSYVQYLQAGALVRIQADNMALIRSNLELARVRHQVGAAGPEEVYRWETQMASSKADLIKAMSDLDSARLEMNRVMGQEFGKKWIPQDMAKDDDDLFFLGGRLKGILQNDVHYQTFTRYLSELGLRESPQLKSLDEDIEAQRILMNQAKRRFVLPDVAASFSLDHKLDEKIVGTSSLPPSDTDADDDEWVAGLQASLPLFKSGGRVFELARAQARLDQLVESRKKAAQLTEQQIKAVCVSIESSYPNMSLQQTAAEFAKKNLDVIKDKYARGVVSILDLLDAQNQSFVANQNAAIAVYGFLSDLVSLQRAISWFEVVKTDAEKDEFVVRYRQCLEELSP